ncbi:MAG: alkaline shock response membrane anchor protein AmaP [bacterium]|nr:alkaline shock response membrane anchor protein AmaP [Candidatus Sumerlaeota bacterium]
MRFLRDSLNTLLICAMLIMGFVGMMAYFPTFNGTFPLISRTGASIIQAWSQALLWVWLGLFLACVLIIVLSIIMARRGAHIEVDMEGGRVIILDSAIRKYVRAAVSEVPGISPQRINLYPTRKGLKVDIVAVVKSDERLPNLQTRAIQRVKSALTDELGISSVAAVHVYIKDLDIRVKPAAPDGTTQTAPSSQSDSETMIKVGPPHFSSQPPAPSTETGQVGGAKDNEPPHPDHAGFIEEEPQSGAMNNNKNESAAPGSERFDPEALIPVTEMPRKHGFLRWRKDKTAQDQTATENQSQTVASENAAKSDSDSTSSTENPKPDR